MSEAEFAALTEEQYAGLVEALAEDDSLDPVEELIRDLFQVDPVLRNVFGPYFDWNPERQGQPYAVCVEVGGGPNVYPMRGGPNRSRSVASFPTWQISVWATDRTVLVRDILPAITRRFEAVHDLPMKHDQHCSSILMRMEWEMRYEIAKHSALNVNCWHAFARFQFITQRSAGA